MIKYSIYFLQSSKYSLHNKHIIKIYNIMFSKSMYVLSKVEKSHGTPFAAPMLQYPLVLLFGGHRITYLISSSTKI